MPLPVPSYLQWEPLLMAVGDAVWHRERERERIFIVMLCCGLQRVYKAAHSADTTAVRGGDKWGDILYLCGEHSLKCEAINFQPALTKQLLWKAEVGRLRTMLGSKWANELERNWNSMQWQARGNVVTGGRETKCTKTEWCEMDTELFIWNASSSPEMDTELFIWNASSSPSHAMWVP